MPKMLKVAIGIAALFAISEVYAGRCLNCKIKTVGCSYKYNAVDSCNIVLDKEIEGLAPCADNTTRMVVDVSKEGGKAMLSVALAAHATTSLVDLYGAQVCDLWDGTETLNMLYIK